MQNLTATDPRWHPAEPTDEELEVQHKDFWHLSDLATEFDADYLTDGVPTIIGKRLKSMFAADRQESYP